MCYLLIIRNKYIASFGILCFIDIILWLIVMIVLYNGVDIFLLKNLILISIVTLPIGFLFNFQIRYFDAY